MPQTHPPIPHVPTTLTEISRRVGCSKASASAVINGSRGNIVVSEGLRDRVLAMARELGYRPNYASRSLALKRTNTLGIYIPPKPWGGIGGQYEGAILRGIENACVDRGYNVLVINVAGVAEPTRCMDLLVEQRIDGLLVLHVDGDEPWIDTLLGRHAAVAAVDCLRPHPEMDAALFDNDAAIRMAVDHLRSQGHQRIGYLGMCTEHVIPHNEVRQQAFIKYWDDVSTFDRRWVFDAEKVSTIAGADQYERYQGGELGIEYFLSLGKDRPTALMVYNDVLAAGAIRQLAQHGMSVPNDMSLITIEDTILSAHLAPRLTSVWHPLDEMGECAANRLIDRAEAKPRGAKRKPSQSWHQRFSPTMRIRESVGPPPLS